MIRDPIAAGSFYERDSTQLVKQIESCFNSEFGVNQLNYEKEDIKAIISPHAGYMFSGPCAIHAYSKLKTEEDYIFVILGVNHTGIDGSGISLSDFKTPLGIVENDIEFSKELSKEAKIQITEAPHVYEHSIEVQLPLIQYFLKNKFKIVPIIVTSGIDLSMLGTKIFELKEKLKRNIVVVASSDFTHYGRNYHYFPFEKNPVKKVIDDDLNIINNYILKKDPEGFIEKASQKTICGLFTIPTMLYFIKRFDNSEGKLLKYYTSYDLYHSDSFVGYASIIFK